MSVEINTLCWYSHWFTDCACSTKMNLIHPVFSWIFVLACLLRATSARDCRFQSDCPSKSQCVEHECKGLIGYSCDANKHCQNAYRCVVGRCAIANSNYCSRNSDCPKDQRCSLNECKYPTCESSLDCPGSLVCKSRKCVQVVVVVKRKSYVMPILILIFVLAGIISFFFLFRHFRKSSHRRNHHRSADFVASPVGKTATVYSPTTIHIEPSPANVYQPMPPLNYPGTKSMPIN